MKTLNLRSLHVALLLCCNAFIPSCAQTPLGFSSRSPRTADSLDLQEAVKKVEDAITYYQTNLRQKAPLPAVSSVKFDFRTTTDISGGGSVSGLYVFTVGASAQRETTHQITYTYKGIPSTGRHNATQPVLFQQLTDTIRTAAEAINAARTFGSQPYQNLDVKIEYGFKSALKTGATLPVYTLITLGLNAEYDKNSIQSVTLTFSPSR